MFLLEVKGGLWETVTKVIGTEYIRFLERNFIFKRQVLNEVVSSRLKTKVDDFKSFS
jgi:hypothetical protein